MKENTIATDFEPNECVIFVQSTKIGTNENKAILSRHIVVFVGHGIFIMKGLCRFNLV